MTRGAVFNIGRNYLLPCLNKTLHGIDDFEGLRHCTYTVPPLKEYN
jgi:hypothetical protein